MKVPFEIEWMGGATEHHFRKVRPAADLPWGTLVASAYAPAAVAFARGAWTEVAINEYRAVASFGEVMCALVEVMAPLDLIGMASDFLADECSHVELASRMAMELGGAVPRSIDTDNFTIRSRAATALQRANDLLLRVSCIAEAFSGGTASVSLDMTTHPLPAAVYETILRDEARHRRLGGLYFEWALPLIDDAERARLGQVMLASLKNLAPFWRAPPPKPEAPPQLPAEDLRALGWLAPTAFGPVARDVVVKDILDPLATIGITISAEERARLLDGRDATPATCTRTR